MGEPVSIASGVAGLVSLGLQVSHGIVEYYQSWRSYDTDVEATVESVDGMTKVLKHLQTRVIQTEPPLPLTPLVENALEGCEAALQKLKKKLDKIKHSPNILHGAKQTLSNKLDRHARKALYPFRQSTLVKLREIAAEAMSSLQLALDVVQFEATGAQAVRLDDISSGIANLIKNIAQEQLENHVQKWLNAPNPSTNFQAAQKKRDSGTGEWFVKSDQYRDWRQGSTTVLWLHGSAGCGKTILCSTIIAATTLAAGEDPMSVVLYYFFDFNDPEKRTAENLIRSLIHQLASQIECTQEAVKELHASCKSGLRQPAFVQLLDTFKRMISVPSLGKLYVLIDALDECDDLFELFGALTAMAEWNQTNLRMFFTSRNERQISELFSQVNPRTIPIENADVDHDIRIHILNQLEEDKWWLRWDDTVRNEVTSTLCERASGMFRWVVCQLEALRRCLNLAMLRKTLHSLPRTLDATYARILENIDEAYHDYAVRILLWLCFARTPLSLEAVNEVVAIGEAGYDDTLRFVDPYDILMICASLVSVVGSNVRLAHFSVREYLTSGRVTGPVSIFRLDNRLSNALIAQACIKYMNRFRDSNIITWDNRRNFALAEYAAVYWTTHLLISEEENRTSEQDDGSTTNTSFATGSRLDTKVVKSRPRNQELEVTIEETVEMGCQLLLDPECFRVLNLMRIVDDPFNNSRQRYWDILWDMAPVSPMYWIATNGVTSVAKRLIEQYGCTMNDEPFGANGSPFCSAIQASQLEMVQYFLERGATLDEQQRLNSLSIRKNMVLLAALTQNERMVSLITSQLDKSNPNTLDDLNEAVQDLMDYRVQGAGHVVLLKILLKSAREYSLAGFQTLAIPLLIQTVIESDEDALEMLLGFGEDLDINLPDIDGRTGLMAASAYGRTKFARRLLAQGADLQLRDFEQSTALHLAAALGRVEILSLLLEAGANINTVNSYGRVPLHVAADSRFLYEFGHHAAKLRMGQNPMVSAPPEAEIWYDKPEDTYPFSRGVAASHSTILGPGYSPEDSLIEDSLSPSDDIALNDKADVANASDDGNLSDVSSDTDWTAQSSTSAMTYHFLDDQSVLEDSLLAVKLLAIRGADLNMPYPSGNTVLIQAVIYGDLETSLLLLQYKADASVAGEHGYPALHIASLRGDEEMVKLLIDHGADPSQALSPDAPPQSTALHKAAESGNALFVALCGTSCKSKFLHFTNEEGKTPLNLALANNHVRVAQALLGIEEQRSVAPVRRLTISPETARVEEMVGKNSIGVQADFD